MEQEYGINNRGSIDCKYHFPEGMRHLCGQTAIVRSVDGKAVTLEDWSGCGNHIWSFSTDMLEPAPSETTITITSDGHHITEARLRIDDGPTLIEQAKCNPEDTFSVHEGARIALARVLGVDPFPEKKKKTAAPEKPSVREVKRNAKAGEWIKVVAAQNTRGAYDNGDVLQVLYDDFPFGVYVIRTKGECNCSGHPDCTYLRHAEYVVLEGYSGGTGIAGTLIGRPVHEVKRHAKSGEYIKIVNEDCSCGDYKNGDIFKVRAAQETSANGFDPGDVTDYGVKNGVYISPEEYVVLEGYSPESEQTRGGEIKRPAEVGEHIKIVAANHSAYKNGDILRVTSIRESRVGTVKAAHPGESIDWTVFGEEYVVLEDYSPDQQPIPEKPEEPAVIPHLECGGNNYGAIGAETKFRDGEIIHGIKYVLEP